MPPPNKVETSTEQRKRLRPREPPPRRRRDAEEAREAILNIAERHLVEAGPAGIRLQEVAADAGVSHPTVLHHFGSREALVKAVTARALQAIHRDLVEAIAASNGEVEQLSSMLEAVYNALHKGGHGRVMLWLALSGDSIDEVDANLRGVVDATHALRRERCADKGLVPSREDTAHVVVLAALALVGSTVMGPTLFQKTGLKDDEMGGVRFRKWLAKLLIGHLEQRSV